jgi:ribosomal protein L11 methyltransferase
VKSGPLWRVSADTTAEAEEALLPVFEALLGQTPSIYTDVETGDVKASVFLSTGPDKAALQKQFRSEFQRLRSFGLDPGTGAVSVTRVRKQDWAESWKRHFKPFTVGGRLLVKPSWSRRKPARGQQVIIIDPGLSFGTGQHATTRFCLEQLVRAREPDQSQRLLDIGTGSGILAIAAAKLGFAPVRAFDFDPVAVRVAKENARRNGVRLQITRADITKMRGAENYDVVCANLTADLLESCARRIAAFVKARGSLALAGILRSQIFLVRKCFESLGFVEENARAEGEWESLLLKRAIK